jgi:hypothetical protein
MAVSFASICKESQLTKDDKTSPYTHISQKGYKYNFRDDAPLAPTSPSRERFIADFTGCKQRPPTEAEYMYAMLALWWKTRVRVSDGISLISKRTDKFKLYLDLDIKFSAPGPDTWATFQRGAAGLVFDTVVRSFPEAAADLEMVLCATEKPRYVVSKMRVNGEQVDKEVEKYGIHLYFPRLVVSFREAVTLVDIITQKARDLHGERNLPEGENAWTDLFDASVYRTGLRDCYTFKVNSCRCFDFSSYYIPKCIVSAAGVVSIDDTLRRERGYLLPDSDIDLTLFELTRIRATKEDVECFSYPMVLTNPLGLGYLPQTDEELEIKDKKRIKTGQDALQYPVDINAQRRFRNYEVLFFSPSDLAKIERAVRENFEEARYRNVQVRTVYGFLYKDRGKTVDVAGKPSRIRKVKITLKGPGSKFCYNKGDHHTNNTVYFELNVKGASIPVMEQKCWSPKSYKRANRERACGQFTSLHIQKIGRVPPSVISLLFHSPATSPDNEHSS